MCGIWGVVARTKSGLFQGDMDAVKMLMLTTTYRGEHSTGLFVTDYQNGHAPPTGVKVEGGPHNIIYNKPLWEELKSYVGQRGGAVIGHGRYATRGKISAKNAHPFQHDHITLVHNGTIYNGLSYAKKGETEVEVDSHALCVAIAERGIEEALTDIHGAYAIIVHDAKEGCLYIARNKERPLWVYEAEDRFYFMSEPYFLRPTVILENKFKDGSACASLKEDLLLKIDLKEPKELQVLCDLKSFAEEKRAKKWQAEKEERERRQKEYQSTSGTNMQQWPTSAGQQQTKYMRPSLARFEVISIESPVGNGSNYTYVCETVDKQPVYFQSNRNIPEYVGKIGIARVARVHNKLGKEWWFVKHRAIEWVIDVEASEGEEEDDPMTGVYFLTANRKRIKESVWNQRRINEGCTHCDHTFAPREFSQVVLTDDDKFLCTSCAAYFNIGNETVH